MPHATSTTPAKPAPTPKPTPTPKADPIPAPAPVTHIPSAVAPKLAALGFPADTADTILRLISLPENGGPEWWRNYEYIEALHDGRGYTVTLYGACSGTGDFRQIVQLLPDGHPLRAFLPVLAKSRGDNIKGLEGMPAIFKAMKSDPATRTPWRQAVWTVYIDLYWSFAARFADKTGDCATRPGPKLTTPLTRGFMVDVALNHGSDLESFNPIIKRMRNKDEPDELAWFYDFAEARRKMLKAGVDDLDTSKTGDRCTLWVNIAKAGNTALTRPIACFNGYWGGHVVIQ